MAPFGCCLQRWHAGGLRGRAAKRASRRYWTRTVDDVVDTAESRALAVQATREGLVLLKNHQDALPLKKGLKIAAVGPHADARKALVGNYLGQQCPDKWDSFSCVASPAEALAAYGDASLPRGRNPLNFSCFSTGRLRPLRRRHVSRNILAAHT